MVRFNIGTHHRAVYMLEKRLDQTFHSIVKFMVSKSLQDNKECAFNDLIPH